MNSRDPQALIEKLKARSPEQVSVVEQFVDFLHSREDAGILTQDAMRAGAATFANVWNSDEDPAYVRL